MIGIHVFHIDREHNLKFIKKKKKGIVVLTWFRIVRMEAYHLQLKKYLQSLQMKEMIEDKFGSIVIIIIIITRNPQFLCDFYCSMLKINLNRMIDRINKKKTVNEA